jgi:hypothetical protein
MVRPGQLGDVVTDVAAAGAEADVANQREIPKPPPGMISPDCLTASSRLDPAANASTAKAGAARAIGLRITASTPGDSGHEPGPQPGYTHPQPPRHGRKSRRPETGAELRPGLIQRSRWGG